MDFSCETRGDVLGSAYKEVGSSNCLEVTLSFYVELFF